MTFLPITSKKQNLFVKTKKMGKKKQQKPLHEIIGIFLKAKCPVTGKEFELKLSEHDIRSHSQECEICGSHGDMTIDYTCPECKEFHEYEIKSW